MAGYEADQTILWRGGTDQRLDLTATTGPDLVVTDINLNAVTTDSQTLIAGGTGKATIRNQGNTDVPADATFAVTFFEDRDGDGAYDPAADNTLGQGTHTGGLAVGAEAEVRALVTGEVSFRDNLIYAFVDSGRVIDELDETNNLNNSGADCEFPSGNAAPDLTASRLLFDTSSLPGELHITARTGNGGALHVGAGVPVAFYDGDPIFGGTLISTAFTSQPLEPGEYEDVTLTWSSPTPGIHDVYVVADDDGTGQGTASECDETNNTHYQTVDTTVIGPDLVVPAMDRSGTRADPQALTIAGDVDVQIENQGNRDVADPFEITLFEDTDGDAAFSDGVDNVLGQRTYYGALAVGQSVWLSVAVSGNVLFRDNLIYAFADSGDAVLELNETNNLNHSGAGCQYLAPESQFQPELEWEWTGSTTLPSSNQVMMTPAVIDLTADGIPDVVFTTLTGGNYFTDGHLRAISGRDGTEIFTVTDPNYDLSPGYNIAVGDIDLDGRPEILAADESERIIAFEHDGTFKWRGPQILDAHWGGVAIADIDQDGTPEIVLGRTVLNNDGGVRWSYSSGSAAVPLVANLDLQGDPEVVAGNIAYHSDGSVYWQNSSLTDGHNAVANFDDDPYPEVVLVTQQKVYLLEHDGTMIWGPAFLPGSSSRNHGGPPTIADVDGDGEPEIGVAGGYAYTMFETDGTLKWSSPTQDGSSTTGSTAFDFEGGGAVEIVYSDEEKLRIYRGSDGTVLWETPSPSGTTYEMPVVADVDADGSAEILVVSNHVADFPGPRGIQVYGDVNNNWVPARKIWNQHTYHVTNVDDDGTVPQVETDNWEVYNNYRVNIRTPRDVPYPTVPDVTASYIRVDVGNYPASVRFTARIGNGGAESVPTRLPAAFYSGDPDAGGVLLGTTTTSRALAPGEYEDVAFTWSAPGLGLQTVYVVADDDPSASSGQAGAGTQNECDEANNIHWYQYITGPEGPDLTVPVVDASAASTDPRGLSIEGTVSAQIHNQGSTAAVDDFEVTFFEDMDGDAAYTPGTDNVLGQAVHSGGLAPGAAVSVEAAVAGEVRFVGSALWAFADSGDAIPELDETNNLNQTAVQCQVNAAPAPDLNLSYLRGGPASPPVIASEAKQSPPSQQEIASAQTARLAMTQGVDLTVRVGNAGEAPVAPGVPVSFYLGDPTAGGTLLGSTATSSALAPGAFEDVTIRWTDETTGAHTIFVTVDAAGECDEANNTYQQRVDILDIPLAERWNLISGWVNPFYTDVGMVQRPISGTYVVIMGFDRGTYSYYPDLPLGVNTLTDFDAEHGYWVKVKPAGEQRSQGAEEQGSRGAGETVSPLLPGPPAPLRIVGTAFPENRELALDAGWNLVSFLSRTRMGVVEGLWSLEGQYTAVLGFDAGAPSYYPFLPPGLNTLSTLEPLYGYWIQMSEEGTLRYPRTQQADVGAVGLTGGDPGAERRARLARQAERTTGVQPTNTWVNLYGPATGMNGELVPVGALVQVYDGDGVPCGAAIVTVPGQYGLLACYGDDPTTVEDEGATPGDVLSLTISGETALVSVEAVWTGHGDLRRVPLGPARLWQVWLPWVRK